MLNNSQHDSTAYARINQNQSPYHNANQLLYPNLNNQPNPIVRDQPTYGQPVNQQGYAYVPQNQGFNPAPQYNQYQNGQINNQGFNPIPNAGHALVYASSTKTMCLTAIVEDLFYIAYTLIYYGLQLNIVFIIMIFQLIRFGILMNGVKNNQATLAHYLMTKKTFFAMSVFYAVYFTVMMIVTVVIANNDSEIDPDAITAFIIVYTISSVIFLLPRSIVICIVKSNEKRLMMPALMH